MATETAKFMSISDFKTLIGKANCKLDVKNNKKDGKDTLFVDIDGSVFKCKREIDFKGELRFLIPLDANTGELQTEQACLVDVVSNVTTVFSI